MVLPKVWLPEGMDPRSSYFLNIRLIGNPKKARKDLRCFCFDKVIDVDITNFKDFIEAIVDQYPSGYLEVPHIHSYDSVVNIGRQRLFKCSFPKLIPWNHLYLSQSGRVMILPHHLSLRKPNLCSSNLTTAPKQMKIATLKTHCLRMSMSVLMRSACT